MENIWTGNFYTKYLFYENGKNIKYLEMDEIMITPIRIYLLSDKYIRNVGRQTVLAPIVCAF